MPDSSGVQSPFFAAGSALHTIRETLDGAGLIRVASAYFEPGGWQLLEPVLQNRRMRLLLGRPQEGSNRIQTLLDGFMDGLASLDPPVQRKSMQFMLDALKAGHLLIGSSDAAGARGASLDARYLYQHGKLYIRDHTALVLTSANFTYTGLTRSIEAGAVIEDASTVGYFVDRFDELFAQAESITDPLIEILELWLMEHTPFQVYARSLLEVYGLPEEQSATLPVLAGYQRPVVARVIQNLESFRGAFLIASTGLGKTVMGAHCANILRSRGQIDQVIILSPAGLRNMWRRMMRGARISSQEFSYNTLSQEDWRRDRNLHRLLEDLDFSDPRTLVILDESHHLRNDDDPDGWIRIRFRRLQKALQNGARILLMTATPYSRQIDDINNQLKLLPVPAGTFGNDAESMPGASSLQDSSQSSTPEASGPQTAYSAVAPPQNLFHNEPWRIERSGDLSALPPCVVLTAPTVVRNFSHRDEQDNRYVLFFGDQKRYFPHRIHIHTRNYQNPFDDFLVELFRSGLLERKSEEPDDQPTLLQTPVRGRRNAFFEALVLHQICSSSGQAKELLSKLADGGFDKMTFARQSELTDYVKSFLQNSHAPALENDSKIDLLVRILKDHPEKTVIFCHYRETARWVNQALEQRLPHRTVASTVDQEATALERLLNRFAPVANEAPKSAEELQSDTVRNPGVDQQGNPEEILEKNPDENLDGNPENKGSHRQRHEQDINILVATGALAEGFNLQDASVLINFDLPWTILTLAQRMGRILRPWHTVREIQVYNLIPSTMMDERLHIGLRWNRRLMQRGAEHQSFADIPLLLESEKGHEAWDLLSLSSTMNDFSETTLDLDEAIRFVENAEQLRTSSFLEDMSLLKEDDIRQLMALTAGFRSARSHRTRRLYLLLRCRNRNFPVLFDERGNQIHMHSDSVLQTIRSELDESVALLSGLSPEEIENWPVRAVTSWCTQNGVSPSEVRIVCSMILWPTG